MQLYTPCTVHVGSRDHAQQRQICVGCFTLLFRISDRPGGHTPMTRTAPPCHKYGSLRLWCVCRPSKLTCIIGHLQTPLCVTPTTYRTAPRPRKVRTTSAGPNWAFPFCKFRGVAHPNHLYSIQQSGRKVREVRSHSGGKALPCMQPTK